MAALTEQARSFLQQPFVGEVTTLRNDGSPHTTHTTLNPIIQIDDAAGTATCRSVYVVFQQVDDFALGDVPSHLPRPAFDLRAWDIVLVKTSGKRLPIGQVISANTEGARNTALPIR